MAILYCYWHLVVKHCNFTLLLTSSSQQWQFPPPHSTVAEDREISSQFNVVIETQKQIYPPGNSSRGQSDLFTVQCCHWHSKADIPPNPPVNTSRGQSDLFTVQYCNWHSKADISPIQHWQRTEWSLHCSMLSLTLKGRYTAPGNSIRGQKWSLHCSMLSLRLKGRYTTPVNTSRGQCDLFTVQCCHWHSKADIPTSQHYQRTEWSLHCSMLSLTLKGRYTHPGQHYQRTEWSLHCSMLSLTLKGRYTPLVNTIRGQSDLFTVQCCHGDSKAYIPYPPISSSISV